MGRLSRKPRLVYAVVADHIRIPGSAKKGPSLARDVYEFREVVQLVLPAITHPGHSIFGTSYATSCSEPALRIVPSESVTRALDLISVDVSCTLFRRLSTDISPRHCLVHGTSASVPPCENRRNSRSDEAALSCTVESFYSYVISRIIVISMPYMK
jgi:hypothetical protein